MSLEDFFTVTEKKNGLSSLPRVEELVCALQNQKDYVPSIVNGATRQWSIITETLAATSNRDCLHHFVQLNGPSILNQWLQNCRNCDKDVSENLVEGLITGVLATFEKLPLDKEKLAFSGIGVTVEHLVVHKNLRVKEKAKTLLNKWNFMRNITSHDLEDQNPSFNSPPESAPEADTTEEVCLTHPLCSISPGRGSGDATTMVDISCAKSEHLDGTNHAGSSKSDTTKDVDNSVPEQLTPTISSASVGKGACSEDENALDSSLISSSCQEENLSITKESSVCPAIEQSIPSTLCRERDSDQQDISVPSEVFGGTEEMEIQVNTKGSPCKSSQKESSHGSSSSDLSASSPSSSVEISRVIKADDFVFPGSLSRAKADVQMDQNSGMGLEYEEIDALEMARQVALEVEREVVDYREPFCSSPELSSGDAVDSHSCREDKQTQPLTADLVCNTVPVEQASPNDDSSPENHNTLVPEDSPDDASSPKIHNTLVPEEDASSPKIQNTLVPEETVPDSQEHEQLPQRHELPSEPPTVTTVAHGSTLQFEKKTLDFDLNEDVCTEEFVCSMPPMPSSPANLSVPKATVAVSRGFPSLPITPIIGEMGWKGSSATSAFRPASSHRTANCIKTFPAPGQNQNFLEIDLNVAEIENDEAVDPILVKQMPLSPNLPSMESSVEVSSRRAERLKLDLNLNRNGDEDISTNRSSYRRLHNQNKDQSLSSASSSSSQQHSMRDFDLNDNPCFIDAAVSRNIENSSSKASTTTYGSSKPNDPGITIMGSRVAVERKDYINQAHHPFMGNGLHMEAMLTARPVLPYAQMPTLYAYNGHPAGPNLPMHPSYYGPGGMPYMVDPRGATFIPHIVGPGGPNAVHYVRPPYIMSGNGTPLGMSGVMPSRSGWDINSGMVSVESGSREVFKQPFIHHYSGGGMEESFQQPFMHGHTGLMEDRARISSQSSSPSMSVKRKEPDCGWESYTLGYKQVTSRQ